MYFKLANLGKSLFANTSILYKKSLFGKSSNLYKKFIFGKSCIRYQKPLFTKVFISYLTFEFTRQYFHHQFLNRKFISINNEEFNKSNSTEVEIIEDLEELICLEKFPPETLWCCIFSLFIRHILWIELSHWERRKIMNMIKSGKFIALISGVIVFLIFINLKLNDRTKRIQLIFYSREELRAKKRRKSGILDPHNCSYYKEALKIVSNIVEKNQLDNVYSLLIIDNDEDNAGMNPNGSISLNKGKFKNLYNNELTFDVSHEIAHYLLNHGAERLSIEYCHKCVFLISILVFFMIFPALPAFGLTWFVVKATEIAIRLPLSRLRESEADELGFFLAAKAGGDIEKMSIYFGKEFIDNHSDFMYEWISTHPSAKTRHSRIEKLIQRLEASQKNQYPFTLGPVRKETNLAVQEKETDLLFTYVCLLLFMLEIPDLN